MSPCLPHSPPHTSNKPNHKTHIKLPPKSNLLPSHVVVIFFLLLLFLLSPFILTILTFKIL